MTTPLADRPFRIALTVACLLGWTPGPAAGQSADEAWQFRGTLYGYFPSLEAHATLPTGAGVPLEVDAGRLIDHLKAAFMGTIEARKGRFGLIADLFTYDVGGSRSGTGTLAVSGVPLPPGVEARATLDVKATAWTLAASWRAVDAGAVTLDAFAGARLLDLRTKLGYEFGAGLGPFVGPARDGDVQASARHVDAIAGLRGRAYLDPQRRWFLPFLVDAGSGDSDLTWQGLAGIGRAIGDAEILAGWRHLAYDFKPGPPVRDLAFDGPVVGLAYRW